MGVSFQDYYETLGLKRGATQDEIQRAYRGLARKYHPDMNKSPDADAKFKQLSEAYEVLKDPVKRKQYDRLGANWKAGEEFNPPPGFQQAGGFHGRSGPGMQGGFSFESGGQFSDFFESFFGDRPGNVHGGFQDPTGGNGARQRARARPQEAELVITLEEAIRGSVRSISLQSPEGVRRLDVKIPPETVDGSKVRLRGQGSGGGDLVLVLRLAAHPNFEVTGVDLTVELKLTPWEAALGIKTPITTLDGPVTLTVPPNTSSGFRLRLKDKGLPKRGGGRGDLYARVNIVVPTRLSDRERELFTMLQKESTFKPRES